MLTMFRFVRCVFLAAFTVVLGAAVSFAASPTFQLKKGLRWVVVASAHDLDQAIGISQHFAEQRTMIVKTDANDLAVVIGPYRATSVAQLVKEHDELPPLAADARLSKGEDFVATVWTMGEDARPQAAPLLGIKLGKSRQLSAEGMSLKAKFERSKTGNALKLVGRIGGEEAFDLVLDNSEGFAVPEVSVGIYKFDPATATPQVLVTTYSGGAHCCTNSWIVTKPAGAEKWQVVGLGERDGDGYALEDVDQDGIVELIGIDNVFLYSFDAYSDSYAPVIYSQLAGDKLVDRSGDKSYRSELQRDLAYIEYDAKADPSRWKSNGFLAAWVASKIRLGQGDDAWTVMLENFNHENETGISTCRTGDDINDCPSEQVEVSTFPKALAGFLQEVGYGPLPMTALSAVQ